jgi:RNA polymerase sigma factor (sigma-70 family)
MQHRKDEVRRQEDHVTLDSGISETILDGGANAVEQIDADWQRAVLAAAVEHVLTKSALSDRDRKVYRAYVQENKPIEKVAAEFGITRNLVSQIKTRIERRIAAIGRQLAAPGN